MSLYCLHSFRRRWFSSIDFCAMFMDDFRRHNTNSLAFSNMFHWTLKNDALDFDFNCFFCFLVLFRSSLSLLLLSALYSPLPPYTQTSIRLIGFECLFVGEVQTFRTVNFKGLLLIWFLSGFVLFFLLLMEQTSCAPSRIQSKWRKVNKCSYVIFV